MRIPLPKKRALMAIDVSSTEQKVAIRWGLVTQSCGRDHTPQSHRECHREHTGDDR
jgi:hypothetical protein